MALYGAMLEAKNDMERRRYDMSYTLSFDASVKCHSVGDVRGLLRHTARDVDKAVGTEVRHSNKDIRPEATLDNATWIKSSDGRHLVNADSIDLVMDALQTRLNAVTGRKVANPVVLRPLILQLDPEWYKNKTQQDKDKAMVDMVGWAAKTFGFQNLVYVSRHVDESNEHLHIGFCPVTEDGRLSQKDWFSGPKKLREMHDDFRQYMLDKGYDIELTRKKPGKHAKRMGVDEYKDYQDLQREREALEARRKAIEARELDLEAMVADYTSRSRVALEGLREATERQEQTRARLVSFMELIEAKVGKSFPQRNKIEADSRDASAAAEAAARAALAVKRPRSSKELDGRLRDITGTSHQASMEFG